MASNHSQSTLRESLRAYGLEHSMTDDEIQWMSDHPAEAVEMARRQSEAAAEISTALFALYSEMLGL